MVAESEFTFEQKLKAARERAARRRHEAFVDYAPRVCGLTLNPVTLASYNRLSAFGSPFVGGGPVSAHDVLVWVWVHHPKFAQDAEKDRAVVFRAAWRNLRPRFASLNRLAHYLAAFPRWRFLARFCSPTFEQRFSEAVAEIRRLMAEAMAGFPPAQEPHQLEHDDDGDRDARPAFDASVSVAFQAQILNTFCRSYWMPYEKTEALPMKKLGQLWREHLYYIGGDKTGLRMMDEEEAALWREQLTEANHNG